MATSTVNTKNLNGFKYLKAVLPLLSRLHKQGCERDRGQNRQLHYDQYAALILLYFFNPIITSLRGLQDATTLSKVQDMIGIKKTALGSLSEAATVFDPALLTEIIGDLGDQLRPIHQDDRLNEIDRTITLVDGTLLPALPKIVEAVWIDDEHRAFKLHLQFELLKSVPVRGDLTAGQADEREVLEQVLEADRLYVLDRGYAKFTLLDKILQTQSSFVCRVRNNSVFDILEDRPLDTQAVQAGIVRDHIVRLGCASKQPDLPHCVRLVQVDVDPRLDPDLRGTEPYTLLLATDLLEVDVTVITLLYRYRWTVELFFRFFKHVLNCRHLLSHSPNGVTIQVYVAIIACLLIALWTGRKATRRTYERLCHYFMGLATVEEMEAHLASLNQRDQQDRGRSP